MGRGPAEPPGPADVAAGQTTGAGWVIAGQIVYAMGLLAGIRVLTQLAGPAVFGRFVLALGVVELAAATLCRPVIQAAVRFFPDAQRNGQEGAMVAAGCRLLGRGVGLGALAMVVLCLAWRPFDPAVGLGLGAAMAALLALDSRRNWELGLLNARCRHRRWGAWQGIEGWLRPAGAVVAVWLAGPLPAALVGGYAAGAAAALAVFGRRRRRHDDNDGRWRRHLEGFARPLTPLALLAWSMESADRYLVAALVSMEAAGLYGATWSLVMRPFMLAGGCLELAVRPLYFSARSGVRTIFARWLAAAVALSALGWVLATTLRGPMCRLLLAPAFRRAAVDLVPILALAAGLRLVGQVMEKPFHRSRRTAVVLGCQAAAAGLGVAAALVLVGRWQVAGAAWAAAAGFAAGIMLLAARARGALVDGSSGSD